MHLWCYAISIQYKAFNDCNRGLRLNREEFISVGETRKSVIFGWYTKSSAFHCIIYATADLKRYILKALWYFKIDSSNPGYGSLPGLRAKKKSITFD
jgi:hypothetical protein